MTRRDKTMEQLLWLCKQLTRVTAPTTQFGLVPVDRTKSIADNSTTIRHATNTPMLPFNAYIVAIVDVG